MAGSFEGWYFKQQNGQDMLALIPAIHTDGAGNRTGSIQVVTPSGAWYVTLPGDAVRLERRPLRIGAGDSVFTLRGIDLNIRGDHFSAAGRLFFGGTAPPRGDIMGPYRFVPLMECRHSVFSMAHTLDGSIAVNDHVYDFSGGVGYIEGDRGNSFPKRYIWAQCSWNDGGPCALMISAADVRPLGREFIGVIGFVLLRGRELRFATYRGAKAVKTEDNTLAVRQGSLTLRAQLLEDKHQALHAPVSGEMVRLVRESLKCRARFTLTEASETVFDFITDQASFEFEF